MSANGSNGQRRREEKDRDDDDDSRDDDAGLWKSAALGVGAAVAIIGCLFLFPPPAVAPDANNGDGGKPDPAIEKPHGLFGWAGEAEAKAARAKLHFPNFKIVGATESAAGKRVVLWDFSKVVNGGQHLPTFRQEIGDCVSMGAANAIMYLLCVQIALNGSPEEYHPIFPPYIYGISRHQIGKDRIGGDGSVGAWAAEGVKLFGAINSDDPQCPKYSGRIASQWGGRSGPPEWSIGIGKQHLVKTTAPVRTYAECRDAICNGYPVTVASNQGFSMRLRVDGGKAWGVPSGSWSHQMCFIGVDDDAEKPGCYCMNSWGEDAFLTPPDGAPPGGFWMDAKTVGRMLAADDSFAYSSFDGFPAQNLDFGPMQFLPVKQPDGQQIKGHGRLGQPGKAIANHDRDRGFSNPKGGVK